ncbi:thrombospondin-type laminin G domain and EAR repeat-containing protein-like [Mytilus edulis]|uniref:thrombospondin-type laminin G domain and EAR repeat-containing protein-like n=1 Tax=Mytilus edulis TaxID=6550 RepID=UPI0039EF8A1D
MMLLGEFACILPFCLMSFVYSTNQIQNSCRGLESSHLLDKAFPRYGRLPKGVSYVYDTEAHVHAYEFLKDVTYITMDSSEILKQCRFFPNEFSVFFIIKHSRTYTGKECVLVVGDNDSNIMSIEISRRNIFFIYKSKKVKFKNEFLRDNKWHTLGFSVGGTHVTMTTDCINTKHKRLKRMFPDNVDAVHKTVTIASCDKNNGVFQGQLRDIIFTPGIDATTRACPSRVPRHTHMNNKLPIFPDTYGSDSPGPQWEDCTWMDVGNIAYDLYAKSLKVCVNGIWKHVTVDVKADIPRKLDYLELYQEIKTPGPGIDVHVFTIDGEGMFAVFANTRKKLDDVSGLYKWKNKKFMLYQKLSTYGAQSWTHLKIQNGFFLAVANYGLNDQPQSNSTIYKWHRGRKRFKVFQTIPTWTARDFEYFKIDGKDFLAVANHAKGSSQDVESVIYKWNPSSQLFKEFQSIMTTGAYDWTYFTVEGYHFLALAQAFNGITTLFESRIYVFQKNGFYLFQTMETNGATDWEFFTIAGSAFLIVANAYNYGPQNFKNKNTYLTNSVLYRLNIDKKGFERFQVFSTYSAVDWEFFSIDDNSYLIVSNAQNGGNEEEQLTTIYRWQGMDKFVPVHKMSTLPNTDWEVFHEGNDLYFIYANAKGRTSQVLKARFYPT